MTQITIVQIIINNYKYPNLRLNRISQSPSRSVSILGITWSTPIVARSFTKPSTTPSKLVRSHTNKKLSIDQMLHIEWAWSENLCYFCSAILTVLSVFCEVWFTPINCRNCIELSTMLSQVVWPHNHPSETSAERELILWIILVHSENNVLFPFSNFSACFCWMRVVYLICSPESYQALDHAFTVGNSHKTSMR